MQSSGSGSDSQGAECAGTCTDLSTDVSDSTLGGLESERDRPECVTNGMGA